MICVKSLFRIIPHYKNKTHIINNLNTKYKINYKINIKKLAELKKTL